MISTGEEARLRTELFRLKRESKPAADRIREIETRLEQEHPEIFFWVGRRISQ